MNPTRMIISRARNMFVLVLLMCGLSAAQSAEHLWDAFDAYPESFIADQRGWTSAPWLNTQTAHVSSARAYSAPHALELPWHADGSSAVYTNFVSTYSPGAEHPVIRFSARIFQENTNIAFQVGIRNSVAGHFLSLQNADGRGTFGFEHVGSGWLLTTNSFIDVTGYYNRSNNTYRFDYDNAYAVLWGAADTASAHAQFNQFVVMRPDSTAQTAGDLFVDNVTVETFPEHVWAWWRCTPQPQLEFVEQLGRFGPAYRYFHHDVTRRGASDPVWDGLHDYRNEGATRLLIVPASDCVLDTPSSTDWTVEAVFRTPPDSSNISFLDWGTELGFNSDTPWLGFGYNASQSSMYIHARDMDQSDEDYDYVLLGPYVPSGGWQHVAVVKSDDTVRLYVDYQYVTNRVLGAFADGAYAFDTLSKVAIGCTLNGGNNSGIETVFDEVRFSGKALALHEFLQPGQPLIVEMDPVPPSGTWWMTMKGILDKTYRVETSLHMGAEAHWEQDGVAFIVEHTFTFIPVPAGGDRNFVRIVRED